jgi:hypothetical protein
VKKKTNKHSTISALEFQLSVKFTLVVFVYEKSHFLPTLISKEQKYESVD